MIDLKRRAVLRSLSTLAGASVLAPAAGATNISALPPAPTDQRIADLVPSPSNRDTYSGADVQESVARKAGLVPDFTFENFVAGRANQLAVAVAQQVAVHPESACNPLFIYGAVGHGKTHLMNAIGHKILERNPQARVRFVHSDEFTSDVVHAYRDRNFDDFRNRYDSLDALLIDDVTFFSGKSRTQEELLWFFDRLTERGRTVVMADAACPCNWLRNVDRVNMDPRLLSRMASSPAFELGNTDLELRLRILRVKALRMGITLDDGTASYIGTRLRSGDIRRLNGALRRTIAHARFYDQDISPRLARQALAGFSLG